VRSHAKAASAPSTHREDRTFSLGVFAAMLACAAAFLGIGAPAAGAAPQAQPGFGFLTTFESDGLGPFTRPINEVGVDSHGNIVVINGQQAVIEIFSPDAILGGTPLTSFSVADELLPDDIAVDPVTDAIYAQDVSIYAVIKRYVSDGQPTPSYTVDPTFTVAPGSGITVDPSTHDLLVADPNVGGIHRYDTTGALVETIPTPSVAPQRIAAAPDGSIYAAQEGNSKVFHFSGAGVLLDEIEVEGEVTALTVNPTSGVLLIAVSGFLGLDEHGAPIVENRIDSYSSADEFLSRSSSPTAAISLAIDGAGGRLYGYARWNNGARGRINVYVPATWPGVEPPTLSDLTPRSVHLSAEVEPGDPAPVGSEAHFEYSSDGGKTWKSTPSQPLSGGLETVEADLTDLVLNFDYQVRAVVTNSLTSHVSDAVSFSTPQIAPEVVAGNATDVTETTAVLNGTVNPAGLQTTYYYEYGTTTTYGSRIPVAIDAVAGGGRVNRIFSRTITGLQPGTTYHFRLVAENAIGITESGDRTFTTVAAGAIPQRAFEQVTPVDKKGNPLDPHFGFMASEDGNAFSYLTRAGESSTPLLPRSVSFRGSEDWQSGIPLDAPTNAIDFNLFYSTVQAISPDFTKAFVASNRALTPDGVENGGNLYVVDIGTDDYTLVGSSPFSLAFSQFVGANQQDHFQASAPDFSWVVFDSAFPLLPDAPFNAYYRWSEGDGLEVISILPDGTPTNALHSPRFHFVSEDGSRFYFTSGGLFESGIPYLRENGETKPLSVSQIPDDPKTPQPGVVLGASKDGRYAFFSDNGSKLTADAPGVEGDVYRYDADDGSIKFIGTHTEGGFPNVTRNRTLAISDNGDTIYLGPLSAGSSPRVWRNGTLTDLPTVRNLVQPEVVASPNGRYLAWAETTGSGTQLRGQISFYDADTNEKFCASCRPDGSPGLGEISEAKEIVVSNRLPHAITDSGQFFFTGIDRLVAADVNGHEDVYMFQDGKPSLITPGKAAFDAVFADVSLDGRDVFFTTSQKLVGRDNDQVIDVYDARVGGGLPAQSPPPPQECLRDDCKGTPNAGPELPFGGSEALSGPENVKPKAPKKHCGKGKRAKKVKGKVRCVKKKRANKAGKGGNR
jgi:hypothetical protein